MLDIMRRKAGSWGIKALLFAIVAVFVSWGVGTYRDKGGSNRVAMVNGEPIYINEYRQAHSQTLDNYRRQLGNNLTEDLIKTLNINKQVMDNLVERKILLQQASQMGIKVTDNLLIKKIQELAAFKENGVFSAKLYRTILSANRITPETFEQNVREDLLAERVRSVITGSVTVPDNEVLEAYKLRERKVSIGFVEFAPGNYKDITPTNEELEKYYAAHKDNYKTTPKIKVRYLRFGFNDFAREVKLSEAEIHEYFESNKDEYATPKQVHARHILFKESKDKALEALKQAREGADFAALALKYSDDPGSKTNGGDLGYFQRDSMVKPFADAAFSMKPGEISEPVRSQFGWHIIKVEEIKEAKAAAYDEVKARIQTQLVQEKGRLLADESAQKAYDSVYGVGHIAEASSALGMPSYETDLFSQTDAVIQGNGQVVGPAQQFAKAAFDLAEGKIGEPVELSDGNYILEVIQRKPAEIQSLDIVRNIVTQETIKSLQDKKAKADAEAFLQAGKAGKDFIGEVTTRGLELKTSDMFKRDGTIAGIGSARELIETAFSLSAAAPLADKVCKEKDNYYVIRFMDAEDANLSKFAEAKSGLKRELLQKKRESVMSEWMAELRAKGNIKFEEGFKF